MGLVSWFVIVRPGFQACGLLARGHDRRHVLKVPGSWLTACGFEKSPVVSPSEVSRPKAHAQPGVSSGRSSCSGVSVFAFSGSLLGFCRFLACGIGHASFYISGSTAAERLRLVALVPGSGLHSFSIQSVQVFRVSRPIVKSLGFRLGFVLSRCSSSALLERVFETGLWIKAQFTLRAPPLVTWPEAWGFLWVLLVTGLFERCSRPDVLWFLVLPLRFCSFMDGFSACASGDEVSLGLWFSSLGFLPYGSGSDPAVLSCLGFTARLSWSAHIGFVAFCSRPQYFITGFMARALRALRGSARQPEILTATAPLVLWVPVDFCSGQGVERGLEVSGPYVTASEVLEVRPSRFGSALVLPMGSGFQVYQVLLKHAFWFQGQLCATAMSGFPRGSGFAMMGFCGSKFLALGGPGFAFVSRMSSGFANVSACAQVRGSLRVLGRMSWVRSLAGFLACYALSLPSSSYDLRSGFLHAAMRGSGFHMMVSRGSWFCGFAGLGFTFGFASYFALCFLSHGFDGFWHGFSRFRFHLGSPSFEVPVSPLVRGFEARSFGDVSSFWFRGFMVVGFALGFRQRFARAFSFGGSLIVFARSQGVLRFGFQVRVFAFGLYAFEVRGFKLGFSRSRFRLGALRSGFRFEPRLGSRRFSRSVVRALPLGFSPEGARLCCSEGSAFEDRPFRGSEAQLRGLCVRGVALGLFARRFSARIQGSALCSCSRVSAVIAGSLDYDVFVQYFVFPRVKVFEVQREPSYSGVRLSSICSGFARICRGSGSPLSERAQVPDNCLWIGLIAVFMAKALVRSRGSLADFASLGLHVTTTASAKQPWALLPEESQMLLEALVFSGLTASQRPVLPGNAAQALIRVRGIAFRVSGFFESGRSVLAAEGVSHCKGFLLRGFEVLVFRDSVQDSRSGFRASSFEVRASACFPGSARNDVFTASVARGFQGPGLLCLAFVFTAMLLFEVLWFLLIGFSVVFAVGFFCVCMRFEIRVSASTIVWGFASAWGLGYSGFVVSAKSFLVLRCGFRGFPAQGFPEVYVVSALSHRVFPCKVALLCGQRSRLARLGLWRSGGFSVRGFLQPRALGIQPSVCEYALSRFWFYLPRVFEGSCGFSSVSCGLGASALVNAFPTTAFTQSGRSAFWFRCTAAKSFVSRSVFWFSCFEVLDSLLGFCEVSGSQWIVPRVSRARLKVCACVQGHALWFLGGLHRFRHASFKPGTRRGFVSRFKASDREAKVSGLEVRVSHADRAFLHAAFRGSRYSLRGSPGFSRLGALPCIAEISRLFHRKGSA
ncbi:hypothetical protein OIU78_027285 [Salix suchowensis]|nr:hypothetical protein OIU78_027285 [Salix suchowensis]